MSARVPITLDPYRASERNAEFSGEFPLDKFKRLNALNPNSKGIVIFEFSFRRDRLLKHCVTGRLSTGIELVCQRCLERFTFPVEREFELKLVNNQAQAEVLDDGIDPLQVEGDELNVIEMLEDELLLAIPDIPRHSNEADCSWKGWQEADELVVRENPFEVLSSLKKH